MKIGIYGYGNLGKGVARIYSNLLFGWEILYSPRTYKRGSSSI